MRGWRNRQTRWIQVPVPERAWGFNSPLAHHEEPMNGSSPVTKVTVRARFSFLDGAGRVSAVRYLTARLRAGRGAGAHPAGILNSVAQQGDCRFSVGATAPVRGPRSPSRQRSARCGPAHRPDAAALVRLSTATATATATTASALREAAARAAEGPFSEGVHSAARPVRAPKVIFVFSGRGSQWVGMGGRGLLDREPAPDCWQFTLGRETWAAGDHLVGGRLVASGAMLLGRAPAGGPRGAARHGPRHLRPGPLPGPLVIGENGTRVQLVLRREVPDGGARARFYDVDRAVRRRGVDPVGAPAPGERSAGGVPGAEYAEYYGPLARGGVWPTGLRTAGCGASSRTPPVRGGPADLVSVMRDRCTGHRPARGRRLRDDCSPASPGPAICAR